jgi:hypothetical protein
MGWMSSRSRNTWPWVRFVVSRDGRRPWVRFVISWRVLRLQRSVYEISEIDLLKIRDQVLPKSEAGQAVSYALKNWAALTRYLEDGDLSIDNNHTERSLRGIAVGRNNWTFVGSDRGGRTMAVLRSFVASCELAKVDPFAVSRRALPNRSALDPAARRTAAASLGSGLLSILLGRSHSDEDLIPLMMFS